MRSEVQKDYDWQNRYVPQAIEILRQNAMHILCIRVAEEQVDAKKATDVIISVEGGDVALRLRRPNCRYRDLTIRSYRANGFKTEIDKIREGFARWYLYCWLKKDDTIGDWLLVDLDQLRLSGLLDNRAMIQNPGGNTGFISITPRELRMAECLVATNLWTR